MKNITGLRVHSAPPSEDPSPVHSFDSEQGSSESAALSGSDGHIEMAKHSHHRHHHHYQPAQPQPPVRHYHPQAPHPQQQVNLITDEDLDQAKSRLHQKRSVRGERRYHTADSIENMKKEKDTSIHKRLSWNYGQQQQQGGMRGGGSGHERLLCNKHFSKCLSSESVYTSSGFSSTGSVPLSVNSCECEQCGAEVLSHIQEIDTADSPSDLGQQQSANEREKPHSSFSMDDDGLEPSDIKIDVSEVKDGISSVQITLSGTNIGKPSKSDLKKMKEFLLTSLEAS